MEVFGKKIEENWLDESYSHAGYIFKQVHREENFIVFKAHNSNSNFELYRRRANPKYRDYRPNKSHWGTYAWTVGSLGRALEIITSYKNK
jgi:hypothetical protein